MSRSVNKVTLIGNLGNEPEVRTTANGSKVATFSLATSRSWNSPGGEKQEKTEWHRCVAWNGKTTGMGLADIVEKYCRKGERVFVEGSIEYGQYKDKEGQTRYTTEIKVRELMLSWRRQRAVVISIPIRTGPVRGLQREVAESRIPARRTVSTISRQRWKIKTTTYRSDFDCGLRTNCHRRSTTN